MTYPYVAANGARKTIITALNNQSRIIAAIMLQDMRTRFGRTYLSYLVSIAWPLFHLAIVIGGYVAVNKLAPVGEDPTIFLGTGLLPYILCLYPARMIAFAVVTNTHLLSIPCIFPFHLMIARSILEIITAFVVCIIFYFTLYMLQLDFLPQNPSVAASAVFASIYFGIGLGCFSTILVALFGYMALNVTIMSMVLLYFLSGAYLAPGAMSHDMLSFNYYNPIFNLVQWYRSAYYAAYDGDMVGKGSVMATSTILLLLGLAGERYLRGKFF